MNKKQFLVALLVLALSGLGGGLVSGWLRGGSASATTVAPSIRAGEILLVDKAGVIQARLEATDKGPSISFINDKGGKTLEMQGTNNSSMIKLSNDKGILFIDCGTTVDHVLGFSIYDMNIKRRASIFLENNSPFIFTAYESGNAAYSVFLANKKAATVAVSNDSNDSIAGISSRKDQSGLLISGEKGKLRAGLIYQQKIGSALTLIDPNSEASLKAQLVKDRGSVLIMKSANKKQVLRLITDDDIAEIATDYFDKGKFVKATMGVMHALPFFSLRHQGGNRVETVFSGNGQPYSEIVSDKKKIWSVPEFPPPGTRDLELSPLPR